MSTLSRVGELVRLHDPDRFFTTLFAPGAARPALWALYAFNHELARAHESVREPMMAAIRLQWWREVVEGEERRHEVATPLREAIAAGALRQDDLLALIEAREEPPETEGEWPGFVARTAGMLAVAAGQALGSEPLEAVRAAGTAYGAAGVLRNRVLSGQPEVETLRQVGLDALHAARTGPLPRTVLAAALPAVYAARDFARVRPVRERPLSDKLAVTVAGLRGTIR